MAITHALRTLEILPAPKSSQIQTINSNMFPDRNATQHAPVALQGEPPRFLLKTKKWETEGTWRIPRVHAVQLNMFTGSFVCGLPGPDEGTMQRRACFGGSTSMLLGVWASDSSVWCGHCATSQQLEEFDHTDTSSMIDLVGLISRNLWGRASHYKSPNY